MDIFESSFFSFNSSDNENSFQEILSYDSEMVAQIIPEKESYFILPEIPEPSISIPNSPTDESKKKIHDKYSVNNMLKKIQIHYLNFIIGFLNEILKNLNYEQRFLKLNYEYKKNVNKDFVERLKKSTLKDIVINKISEKYKNYDNYKNRIIYEEIKENEIIKNILSINYLMLFKTIYYKSNKKIDLSQYGINQVIILSKKVKMFNDLLKKIEKQGELYIKNIANCTIKNFIPDCKF